MWTRLELKTRAKAVLRVSYWKALLVSLIIAFVGGGSGGGGFSYNFSGGNSRIFKSEGGWISPAIVLAILGVVAFAILFALAFRIFVGYALEVGGRSYFVNQAQGNPDLNAIGFSFRRDRYIEIIKAMLWKGLFNFLWYLALIIPGYVKMYSYSMVPYILTNNPNIGYRRALNLSKEMTCGHKLDMFVLDLSFLGWSLLGLLACCVGVFFVLPYIDSTKAELYLVLRQIALDKGICTYEELLLNPPAPQFGDPQV